jgi:hypothetical protein
MFRVAVFAAVVAALSCVVVIFLTFVRNRGTKSRPLGSTVTESGPGDDRLLSGFARAHVIVFQSFFIAFTVLELTKVIFGIDVVALLRHWIGQ